MCKHDRSVMQTASKQDLKKEKKADEKDKIITLIIINEYERNERKWGNVGIIF